MTTKKPLESVSRLTQKTFIITAAIAYLAQTFTVMQSYVAFQLRNIPYSGVDLYSIQTVILPPILVVMIYFILGNGVGKLKRLFQAVVLATVILVFQSFVTMINYDAFRYPLGYANAPATAYSIWLELIPVVVSMLLAVALGWYFKRVAMGTSKIGSTVLQKIFIISMPLSIIGSIVMTFFDMVGAEPTDADSSYLIGNLTSLIIPAIVLACLYMLVAKAQPKTERLFVAMLYLAIGASIIMIVSSVFSVAYWWHDVSMNTVQFTYIPEVVGLVIFGAIVAWHKVKRAL
jgi:hypothetical protein